MLVNETSDWSVSDLTPLQRYLAFIAARFLLQTKQSIFSLSGPRLQAVVDPGGNALVGRLGTERPSFKSDHAKKRTPFEACIHVVYVYGNYHIEGTNFREC